MKKFVAILKEKRTGELSEHLLRRHVDQLRKFQAERQAAVVRTFRDSSQAIRILICDHFGEATAIMESDPFNQDGDYASYGLKELLEANEDNNWLM